MTNDKFDQLDFNTRDRIQKVAQILCDPLRLTYWAMENNLSLVEAQRRLREMALPYWSPDLVQADHNDYDNDEEDNEESPSCEGSFMSGTDSTRSEDRRDVEMIFSRDEDIV